MIIFYRREAPCRVRPPQLPPLGGEDRPLVPCRAKPQEVDRGRAEDVARGVRVDEIAQGKVRKEEEEGFTNVTEAYLAAREENDGLTDREQFT